MKVRKKKKKKQSLWQLFLCSTAIQCRGCMSEYFRKDHKFSTESEARSIVIIKQEYSTWHPIICLHSPCPHTTPHCPIGSLSVSASSSSLTVTKMPLRFKQLYLSFLLIKIRLIFLSLSYSKFLVKQIQAKEKR